MAIFLQSYTPDIEGENIMKRSRHGRILRIITENPIQTQEQLTEILKKEGFAVTQATVSRDIKELGLVKVSSGEGGYRYAQGKSGKEHGHGINMFSKAVTSVEYALHTVVIKTYAGMAQGVAASLDAMPGEEVLGSVAGDDTVILIMRSEEAAARFVPRLERLLKNM